MSNFSEAIKIFIIHFFRQMLFLNSIMLPILLHYGLKASDYFFLNGVFLSTLVISDLPSGIFSDKFGARKSIILSGVLAILGSLTIIIGQSIIHFMFFNIFSGLSLAFLSGSDLTILLNTNKNPTILGKKIFFKRAGNVSAAIISGTILLYNKNYLLLMYLQLLASCIALILSLSISYKNGIKKLEKEKIKTLKSIISDLYLDKNLFYLFFILLISSSSFFLLINSFQPLLNLYNFDPSWFAFIYGGFQLLQGFICLYGEKFKNFGYSFSAIGPILGTILIYFTQSSIILIISFIYLLLCRSLFFFLMEKLLRNLSKNHIATYSSLFNTIANIAVSIQSFIMGMLINHLSLKDSLLLLSIITLIVYFTTSILIKYKINYKN